MRDTSKPAVQFSNKPAPYVQQGVDPRAAAYRIAAAERRGGLQKDNTPVAGGAPVAMPALEQPHIPGRTMAEQAYSTRGSDTARNIAQATAAHAASGGIIVPDVATPPFGHTQEPQGRGAQDLDIRADDMLPPEATRDPAYQQGIGSGYAASNPALARKYGVVRRGQKVPPADLVRAPGQAPRTREDTLRDLGTAMAVQTHEAQRGSHTGAEPAQDSADESGAYARTHAPRTAGMPLPAGLKEDEEESTRKSVREALEGMDDIDMDRVRRLMLEDVLKSDEQKAIIEKRLTPLSIEDLIIHGQVRQRVIIHPGVFEVTFESMTSEVELRLKQLLVLESKSVAVTEAYLLDKYAIMTATAGTFAINGRPLPSMYDERGVFSDDGFSRKLEHVNRLNIHMLASIGVNYAWFEARVRKLFVAEEGKGG